MANFVEFKGLKHYPLGDSELEITNNNLVVSNIGPSGFDGVSIDSEFNANWHAQFQAIELGENKNSYIRLNGRDSLGRPKTKSELVVYYDPSIDKIRIAVNSRLLPQEFQIIGLLNGSEVFNNTIQNYDHDPSVNYLWVAYLLYVLDHASFSYTYKKITAPNGDVTTEETTTVDWNAGIAVNTGGDDHTVDALAIKSARTYPAGTAEEVFSPVTNVEIRGRNTNSIVIENEDYS